PPRPRSRFACWLSNQSSPSGNGFGRAAGSAEPAASARDERGGASPPGPSPERREGQAPARSGHRQRLLSSSGSSFFPPVVRAARPFSPLKDLPLAFKY